MGIRVEHVVYELPKSYVTKETVYSYEKNPDDEKGPKIRKETEVENRGGYLVKFMRGHSIRAYDEAHLNRLGFRGTKPRLIDEASGLEVNEQGIPLDIAHLTALGIDGNAGTDVELGAEGVGDNASIEAMVEQYAKE